MLSSLLPLPLRRQNIPDECNIPRYPQNIQFPGPQWAQWWAHHPTTTSGIVYMYLLSTPTPCTTAPPYYTSLPSHLAPSASLPPYLLIQKTVLLILSTPGSTAGPCFSPFFGWWATTSMHVWSDLGLIHERGYYRWEWPRISEEIKLLNAPHLLHHCSKTRN